MISIRTQLRLAELIKTIAYGEKQTELARQILAEQIQFEPHTAFRRIDMDRDGYIQREELQDFLEKNGIICSLSEATYLLNMLDANDDGRISYSDFQETILPQENYRLKSRAKLRDPYYLEPNEPLPYEIEWRLARVLEQEVKNFRLVETNREILLNSYDFDTMNCFYTIDVEKLGVIDEDNLNYFMRNSNCILSLDELRAFIRVVGSEELGRISYSQFHDVLNPLRSYQPRPSFYRSPIRRQQTPTKRPEQLYTSPRRRQVLSNADYYDYLSKSINRTLEKSYQTRYYSPKSVTQSQFYSPYKTQSMSKSIQQFYSPVSKLEESKMEKYSPMKANEETHLVQALKQQINVSKEIDELKRELALRQDFNLFDAFKIFDKRSRGYLTKYETEQILNSMQIFPTSEQMYLLFKKMDKDGDGFLTYSEFCDAVLPQSENYQVMMNSRIPQYVVTEEGLDNFQFQTKYLFKKLINKMIEGELEAETIRQKLSKRPLFSLNEAFSAIDKQDNGFITKQQLKKILSDYGVFADSNDLQQLINRYDKDDDGKVSYKEFIQELTPQSPYKTKNY